MASVLLDSYNQWANSMDTMLMDWVDPTLRYRQSPMQDYFLADFGTVFALCVSYLLFVVVGTVSRLVDPSASVQAQMLIGCVLSYLLCLLL